MVKKEMGGVVCNFSLCCACRQHR